MVRWDSRYRKWRLCHTEPKKAIPQRRFRSTRSPRFHSQSEFISNDISRRGQDLHVETELLLMGQASELPSR